MRKITPEMGFIGEGFAATVYVLLAFYELISNFENLRDSGLLLAVPILNKIKKEQDKFLNNDDKK